MEKPSLTAFGSAFSAGVSRALALCCAFFLLFSVITHACHADDLALGGNAVQIVSVGAHGGDSNSDGVAATHCHACFSYNVTLPAVVAGLAEPAAIRFDRPTTTLTAQTPSFDSPPPKA